VQQQTSQSNATQPWSQGALVLTKINDDTVAKVSTDGAAVRNTTLQG
jgi:hypothetical protein